MKRRLKEILIERGFAEDRREAFVIVTEGRVYVNGQKAVSPGQMVDADAVIEVRPEREFVGRGAYKLEAAVKAFGIQVSGTACADIGAAIGGFTEVFLKHGAAKVYAIDLGRGKLDLKLRQDPRVVVMEEVNVLSMPPLPELVDLVAIDVSFTSLRIILPKIRPWLRLLYKIHDRGNSTTNLNDGRDGLGGQTTGRVIALFKPQYEIEDKSLLKRGVLRDEAARSRLVERFRGWLRANDWRELGFMESPIRGSEGNVEYLFYLRPA